MRGLMVSALGLLAATAAGAQDPVTPAPREPGRIEREAGIDDPVRSPRNANYEIEARLDPETRMLRGRQIVEWRNIQAEPTEEVSFHLYWNGWRNNQSTWLREDRYRGRSDRGSDVAEGDWAYQEVHSARLLATGGNADADLLPGLRFIAPDDGNAADRTVFRLSLPRPVGPGESIEIELEWEAKIPRTFARTGFRGNFFYIAHWFPKLGVFEDGGWTTPQFHSATEFYSNFGVYDVELTVPTGWVLGATGRKTEKRDNGDGTTTHRHVQADVHGFAWTTSPDFEVVEDRFEVTGLPPVDVRLLMQPEHRAQTERHLTATKAALEHYGRWYGPYPYGHVTVVDPAYGSGAGGMEYPTIFTCGTRLINPFGGGSPEGVTIHEAGHQFWYGIVGNNELDYAWIDEGLNSFSDARVYDVAFGPFHYRTSYFRPPGIETRGFFRRVFHRLPMDRAVSGNGLDRYRRVATSDVQGIPTWRYHPATASGISYSKTAVWLHTLERHLGWEALQPVMAAFFERGKFAHPRRDDFEAVFAEAGHDLDWFFGQIFDEARWWDYAVDSASSRRVAPEGFFSEGSGVVYRGPEDGDDTAEKIYRTEVVVRRLGSGVFPVTVEMVFEGGEVVRREWDGRYRWHRFEEERPAKLERVRVDPERVLLLDLDYTNNSKVLGAKSTKPAVKWASRWTLWLQDLLHAFAYFV